MRAGARAGARADTQVRPYNGALRLLALCALLLLAACGDGVRLPFGPTPTPRPPLADFDDVIATAEAGQDPAAQARGYFARGDAQLGRGELEAAVADYTRAVTLDPTLSRAFNNRALAHEALGDSAAALADYDAAIAADPTYIRAHKNRLALLERTGGDVGLIAMGYGRLAELEPAAAAGHRYRQGAALIRTGDRAGALVAFDAALAADPQQVDARYERGLLRFAAGDAPGALEDLDAAIRLSPRAANAYYARGLVYSATGDQQRAVADFAEALELRPAYPEALLGRAAAYLAAGDRERAAEDLARVDREGLDQDLQTAAAAIERRLAAP